MAREEERERRKLSNKHFCYINSAFRIWGAITLIVLWFLTIFTIRKPNYEKHVITWYLLVTAILVTIFEALWLFNLLSCFKETGCCYCRCWKYFMLISRWRKGILYILFAIPSFWIEQNYIQSIIVGIMLTISGIFYILMSILPLLYREKRSTPEQFVLNPTPKLNLVTQEVSTQTDADYYSRIYNDTPPKYLENVNTVAPRKK